MVNADISSYSVSPEAFNLRDVLKSTMQVIVGIYEQAGVPLPTRQYYTSGTPSHDCEQVVVAFQSGYLGVPGTQTQTPQDCDTAPRTASLSIYIDRKYPIGAGGNPIAASRLQEAGDWSAVDAWLLLDNTKSFDQWGDLYPGLGIVASVAVNEPSGGLQTTLYNITLAVP